MLIRPPPYEIFFAPLTVSLSPNNIERVQFAYIASKYGHADQVRDDGTRYFDHPKAATWIYIHELDGRDVRTIIDTLLHDLSEDQYLLSPYRLARNFGKNIALDVRGLTKLPEGKETTRQYLMRVIERGPSCITAKLVDRLHNLRTLGNCTQEKRARIIKETDEYHLKLLVHALRTYGKKWTKHAVALEAKIVEAIRDAS